MVLKDSIIFITSAEDLKLLTIQFNLHLLTSSDICIVQCYLTVSLSENVRFLFLIDFFANSNRKVIQFTVKQMFTF